MTSSKGPTFQIAEFFNALAHPSRLEILEILRDGEACVCHIQAMLEQRQAYVSQHLNVLKQAGLVTSRKAGLRVYYQISDPRFYVVIDQVAAILQSAGESQPVSPTDYDERKKACTCPQCTGQVANQPINFVQVQYD